MRGELTLYLDQYGTHFFVKTVKELRCLVGGGRVSKMYQTLLDGTTVHCGYVIGNHWFRAYKPVELPA